MYYNQIRKHKVCLAITFVHTEEELGNSPKMRTQKYIKKQVDLDDAREITAV